MRAPSLRVHVHPRPRLSLVRPRASVGTRDTLPAMVAVDSKSRTIPPGIAEIVTALYESHVTFTGDHAHSSRIEYCKSLGIDYEKALKYSGAVEIMEHLWTKGNVKNDALYLIPPPSRKNRNRRILPGEPYVEAVAGSPDGMLRVLIYGMSDDEFETLVNDGRCPLCRKCQHRLAMCPNMPNELRPFC